jgi:hypothetical protein
MAASFGGFSKTGLMMNTPQQRRFGCAAGEAASAEPAKVDRSGHGGGNPNGNWFQKARQGASSLAKSCAPAVVPATVLGLGGGAATLMTYGAHTFVSSALIIPVCKIVGLWFCCRACLEGICRKL